MTHTLRPSRYLVFMHCPRLADLPAPPFDKTGWPWTEESPRAPDAMPNGKPWPRISIVTPSFNQGQFLEETIRSVLLQGYPDLEYIVVDAGSTDASLEIIRKYEPWLSQWVSEPDRGQSHAINKGMRMATGEIVNWLNSDDSLLPGALNAIATTYNFHLGSLLVGAGIDVDEASREEHLVYPKKISVQNIIRFWEGWFDWLQPSIFFPRESFWRTRALDERLHFSMDIDLYCRLMQIAPAVYTSLPLSRFRRHKTAKTQSQYDDMMLEHIRVVSKYKQLLDHQDAKDFEAQKTLFLLRRMKRLLLDGRYRHLMRYFQYNLESGLSQVLGSSANLVLSKLRLTKGGLRPL